MEPFTYLEACPDAMVVTDRDGRIAFASSVAEDLFGYERSELLGKTVEILVPSQFRSAHVAHREMFGEAPKRRKMGTSSLPLFGVRKDGSEFEVEISLSSFVEEGRQLTIAAIRDVTQRRAEEEERAQLKRASEEARSRSDFLTVVCHELSTPVTTIHLQVGRFLREMHATAATDASQAFASKFEIISRASARIEKLINELFDQTRIADGRLSLRKERVDLSTLVEHVVVDLRDRFDQAGCHVRRAIEPNVTGLWDAFRLEQIALNLITNAIKFGSGSDVTVGVSRASNGHARLVVEDHGMGIAAEDQARIFSRFERAKSAEKVAGIGVGLWVVRELVRAHGGEVHVTSAPGEGARFVVDLPCHHGVEGA